MPTLSRTVPLLLRPAAIGSPHLALVAAGGQPGLEAPGFYCELDVQIRGAPEARGGYIISISEVDSAIRHLLPAELAARPDLLEPSRGLASWCALLHSLAHALATALGRGEPRLELRWSPFLTLSVDPAMPDRYQVTRRFDFSSSHRLHIPGLSDQENFARFGKCSRASGHGHNYRLDVTISRPAASASASADGSEWIEVVEREVIERYDHRHLNLDCPEFASFNPSVEHIAQIIFDRLHAPLGGTGVRLERVCVWETEKTWCAYPQ
ncbi:MAG: 6-carboxytetrahydropterin synthase [Phycisphaeraceae bacterium]|nr:6-carboxytetrahydropterin synthase [Phycisphaeraceae bacterium]